MRLIVQDCGNRCMFKDFNPPPGQKKVTDKGWDAVPSVIQNTNTNETKTPHRRKATAST